MKETENKHKKNVKGVGVEVDSVPEWPTIGMTVTEAAQALRVSPRTVQDMLAAGQLPGRLIGNKWRISPRALDRFLDDFEHTGDE